jgi:pilus assembly protein CpaF
MFRHFEKRMPEAVPARANGRANPLPLAGAPAADGSSGLEFTDLKVRLHQRLLDMLNLGAIDKVPADELQREVGAIVRELLLEDGIALNAKEYSRLVEEILDEVLGLGPLEPLLKTRPSRTFWSTPMPGCSSSAWARSRRRRSGSRTTAIFCGSSTRS